ncbi:MAG: PEP-CTERM sorting domain-containing protein [Phycisphaerae bacterium]|jgi:hypothetical protein
MKTTAVSAALILSALMLSMPASADCPLGHTHIGINPTWRPDWSEPGNPDLATDPDPDDNNQLWLFSIPPIHPVAPTPGWPEWGDPDEAPFLRLVQETDAGGDPITKPDEPNKTLYVCRFMYGPDGYGDPNGMQHLDGWHSANGPQGVWNLAGGDESNEPAWDIGLRRESTSLADPTDFLMIRPDDTVVLAADGDTYMFADYGEKAWDADNGAWGIHSHMGFFFWLDNPQPEDVFSATLTAFDDGGMYTASDPFTFRFAVPEPGTLGLVLVAGLLVGSRRR